MEHKPIKTQELCDAMAVEGQARSIDAGDASRDKDGDGYTNLEEYLNGIDPTVFVDYTKPENNINTLE